MAHVLVVDDEKSIRLTLGAFLKGDGHTVSTAANGEEAVRLLASEDVDVVVADLLMPGIGGLEVLQAARERNPHTQIILITGQPTLDSASEAVRLRAFDYLDKPIPKDSVLRSVRGATEAKRREDELERLQEENRRYQEKLEEMVDERTHALSTLVAKLESVTSNSPDFIMLLDANTNIQFINRTLPGMTADQVVGTSIDQYLPQELLPLAKRGFSRVRERGEPKVFEVPWREPGGSVRYYRASVGLVVESGKHVGFVLNATDVTDSRQAEQELRLKDIVFESSIAANSTSDKYGNITHANAAFLTMWGYAAKSDVIGQPLSRFFAEGEDTGAVVEALNKTGVWEGTFRAKRSDGSTFISQGLATVVRNGGGEIVGYQSANLDVTQIVSTNDELHRITGQLQGITDSAVDCIFCKGPDFRYTFVNPAMAKLLGRPADDLIGKTPEDIWEAEDAAIVRETDRRCLDGETVEQISTLEAGSESRTFHTIQTPLHGQDGEIIGECGIVRDITLQTRAERLVLEQERLWRGVLEHVSSGIAIYRVVGEGEDFILEEINPAGAKIVSAGQREELIGRSVQDAFPGIADLGLLDLLREVWRTGKPGDLPATLYHDNRITLWVENYVFKLQTGEIVALFDDATESRLAQADLETVKTFYLDILDSVPDGIWVTDKSDAMVFFNHGMERIAGVPASEVLDLNVTQDFADETIQHFLPHYERARDSLETVEYEAKVVTPAGRETVQRGWLIPRVSDGHYDGMVCTVRDVTESCHTGQEKRGTGEDHQP